MKEIDVGQIRNYGIELLNDSFVCETRYWFDDKISAMKFRGEIEKQKAPAFVRFIKVIR